MRRALGFQVGTTGRLLNYFWPESQIPAFRHVACLEERHSGRDPSSTVGGESDTPQVEFGSGVPMHAVRRLLDGVESPPGEYELHWLIPASRDPRVAHGAAAPLVASERCAFAFTKNSSSCLSINTSAGAVSWPAAANFEQFVRGTCFPVPRLRIRNDYLIGGRPQSCRNLPQDRSSLLSRGAYGDRQQHCPARPSD
jgi:hypothetical protein